MACEYLESTIRLRSKNLSVLGATAAADSRLCSSVRDGGHDGETLLQTLRRNMYIVSLHRPMSNH